MLDVTLEGHDPFPNSNVVDNSCQDIALESSGCAPNNRKTNAATVRLEAMQTTLNLPAVPSSSGAISLTRGHHRSRMSIVFVLSLWTSACTSIMEPPASDPLLKLATRAERQGEFDAATKLYEEYLETHEVNETVLLGLGRSYTEVGHLARAALTLEQVELRWPSSRRLQVEQARLALASDRPEDALLHASEALSIERDLDAVILKGIALDTLGNHAEAQRIYEMGLELNPADSTLLNNYAISLAFSGSFEKAIAILTDLQNSPEIAARARGNLALAYGIKGDEARARSVLANELTEAEIEQNIRYYRVLRSRRS
jgi:Flp pilus assembly protein TadD